MVAFAAFVVETYNSFAVTAIIQPVFEKVRASRNGLWNLPNHNFKEAAIRQSLFCLLDEDCIHVDNHVITITCCQSCHRSNALPPQPFSAKYPHAWARFFARG